jgi:hypothetical protein
MRLKGNPDPFSPHAYVRVAGYNPHVGVRTERMERIGGDKYSGGRKSW